MSSIVIEILKPTTIPYLLPVMQEYLDFYQKKVEEEQLTRFLAHLCVKPERGQIWLAVMSKKIVGFATVYTLYSTLQAQHALMLNDLFVIPSHRNLGVGSRLFETCKKFYLKGDYAYLEWMTDAKNKSAIQFYLKHNAKETEWKVFRV